MGLVIQLFHPWFPLKHLRKYRTVFIFFTHKTAVAECTLSEKLGLHTKPFKSVLSEETEVPELVI